MPDLLVVVLEVTADELRASVAEVDRPGAVLRDVTSPRTADLPADAAAVLVRLQAADLAPVLLALAVSLGADVDAAQVQALRTALHPELPAGWGLPSPLPVVWGTAQTWAREGAAVAGRPAVASAVVAAARSVGAHAHLPRAPRASDD